MYITQLPPILATVKAYGVQEPALQLLRSYLHGRKQRVICNNKCSSWSTVRCGVPQGSLLSPLLFNIFMNDINETVTVSSLRLYADDTTQYTADYSPVVLQHLCVYLTLNKLSYFILSYLVTDVDSIPFFPYLSNLWLISLNRVVPLL